MSKFKRLFLDIETSPNLVFTWKLGKNFLSHDMLVNERKIICVAYKWEDEKTVKAISWDLKKQCDKSLLKDLSKIMLEADEIVAHNGDAFDMKYINSRLLAHKMPALGPISTADTLKMSRKTFYLNSHKLDYISKLLKIGGKKDPGGINTWKAIVINKDKQALNRMVDYCKQDIYLLEKVYKEIVKYAPSRNSGRSISGSNENCHQCGHHNVIKYGRYTTNSGVKNQKFKCLECGKVYKVKL